MRSDLKGDIAIRLLALAIAVTLWFVASEDLRVESVPMEERVLPASLRLVGVAEELIAFHDVTQVEVRLRGPANMAIPEELEAFVDMTGKRAGQHRVTPQVSMPSRFSLLAVKPETVHIRLEPEITRSVPVVTAVIGLPPGTEVVIGRPEPAAVRISGARSKIDQVARIYAIATYDAAESLIRAGIKIVDVMDQEVTDLVAEPTHVHVSVDVKPPSTASESSEPSSQREVEPDSIDTPPSSVQTAPPNHDHFEADTS
ncbi:MAG: YbbR-like domain-containing protein [Limnochordia bacterium]|jgi:YbbR domain-containing protein